MYLFTTDYLHTINIHVQRYKTYCWFSGGGSGQWNVNTGTHLDCCIVFVYQKTLVNVLSASINKLTTLAGN